MAMVVWHGEVRPVSVQQARMEQHQGTAANNALFFAVGFVLRFGALVLATLALLAALAGAAFMLQPTFGAPAEEQTVPILIPTPSPEAPPA